MGSCFVLCWTCLLDTLHRGTCSSPARRNLIIARLQEEPAKSAKIFRVFTHSHPPSWLLYLYLVGVGYLPLTNDQHFNHVLSMSIYKPYIKLQSIAHTTKAQHSCGVHHSQDSLEFHMSHYVMNCFQHIVGFKPKALSWL